MARGRGARGGEVQAAPAPVSVGTTAPEPTAHPLAFATEGASVLGVLADFNLLHHFPEGGTVLGAFIHVTVNQVGTQRETRHLYLTVLGVGKSNIKVLAK